MLPDVPAQEDLRLPETAAENVGHAFAAARAETKKFRDLAEQYRQQAEKMKADYESFAPRETAFAEKLTAEQNRSRELEERLGRLDLEQAPSFREKYDVPIKAVRDEIARTLAANGYQQQDADELAKQIVLGETAQEVAQLPGVSELPSTVQGMLMYKFSEADGLWAQRGQALAQWRTTQQGLEQTTHREDAVTAAQRRLDLVSTGLDRVAKVVPGMIWSDPEFAKFRESEVEKVKAWYGQASDDQIATAAVEGAVVAPFVYKLVDGLAKKVMELQGVIDTGHRVASPSTVPYYRPPTLPAPVAPPTAPATPESWSEVDAKTDPVAAASGLAGAALKRMFQA